MNNEEFVVKLKQLEKTDMDDKEGSVITALVLTFGFFVVLDFYVFGLIRDLGVNIDGMVLTTIVLIFLTLFMSLVCEFLIVSKLDPKSILISELKGHIYTGELKYIFDFSIPEINSVLKEMDKKIEASIIKNKGLIGADILLIKEKTKPFTDKIAAESKEKEEMIQQEEIRKALIEAQTVSGKMLEEFENLIK